MDANWLSAVAALAALVFSVFAHVTARRSKRKTELLEEKNAALAEAQTRLAHRSWSDEYFREVTVWACQMTTAISRAIHLVGVDDERERREALITISACIDMGRWYFPNRNEDDYGHQKEPAYRGLRQPLLDWAVRAYDICADQRTFADPKEELITCQRNFVSEIQKVVDPRSREEAIAKILSDFGPVAQLPEITSPMQSP